MDNDKQRVRAVRRKQRLEQHVALLVDTLPGLWWGLYHGLRKEGFTEEQAMVLVQDYIGETSLPVL
jgi:hypothetical protein